MSTTSDLDALKGNWREDLTWDAFGNSVQADVDVLKDFWFPGTYNALKRIQLQDIWTRHPKRQKGKIKQFKHFEF
jgi:hypothetical protein